MVDVVEMWSSPKMCNGVRSFNWDHIKDVEPVEVLVYFMWKRLKIILKSWEDFKLTLKGELVFYDRVVDMKVGTDSQIKKMSKSIYQKQV